jgi:membrane protein
MMLKKLFDVIKTGTVQFIADDCMSRGAALAYYTIFSLPPLLLIVFLAAGSVGISDDRISDEVREQIGMPVPEPSETPDSGKGATSQRKRSTWRLMAERQGSMTAAGLGPISKVVGVAILFFSATGVFVQLQQSLNQTWHVEPDPDKGGWKTFLLKRFLSMGMILVIFFLLLVSLIASMLIEEMIGLIVGTTPTVWAMTIGVVIDQAVTLVLTTLLFAAMFKILPDANIPWRDMWVGAIITAMLFVVGKSVIGWYLQNSQIGSVWGTAAASMVVLLLWVYYMSLVVLYGAELSKAWSARYGRGVEPSKNAVRVVEEKVLLRDDEPSRSP